MPVRKRVAVWCVLLLLTLVISLAWAVVYLVVLGGAK